ncbi:unnamed protein product [Durusdinium trenchii]|uniref:PPM-type phosphatase domain-containing protein n=1 Tax=Durusdinium trenchii TaxID=1381693 RepID=A0ABP0SPF0_9DINO
MSANGDAKRRRTLEKTHLQLRTAVTSEQGKRPAQEDRYVLIPDLAALAGGWSHLPEPCSLFGVFDGHMGATCSEFMARRLPEKLLEQLSNSQQLEKITTLMEELFKELDDDFLTEHDCPDGSTAIIALVLGTDLFIANLGDSSGVLCGEKATTPFIFPHKPGAAMEKKRISEAGGHVLDLGGTLRVVHPDFQERIAELRAQSAAGIAGDWPQALSLSRAFGDRDFKNLYDGFQRVDLVSCCADVVHVQLETQHKALVLVSDGVTDVLSLEEVSRQVMRLSDPAAASKAVCNESFRRCTTDNVTALRHAVEQQQPSGLREALAEAVAAGSGWELIEWAHDKCRELEHEAWKEKMQQAAMAALHKVQEQPRASAEALSDACEQAWQAGVPEKALELAREEGQC